MPKQVYTQFFDPIISELSLKSLVILWKHVGTVANEETQLSCEFDNSKLLTTKQSRDFVVVILETYVEMYRIHTSLSSMHCCVGCYCRYGQMTAGSYCYIGPQGIVHGTVVRNWGRVYCQYLLEAGISGVAGDCSGMVCCERMFWLPKKFSLLKKIGVLPLSPWHLILKESARKVSVWACI